MKTEKKGTVTSKIKRGDQGWQMTAQYEETAPMFGNFYLLMAFNSTVVIN